MTVLIVLAFCITYLMLCLFEGYYNSYYFPIIAALSLRYGMLFFFLKWLAAAGFLLVNVGFGLILIGEAGGLAIAFARSEEDR